MVMRMKESSKTARVTDKGNILGLMVDVYEGEFKDGESHGQGKYTWANGSVMCMKESGNTTRSTDKGNILGAKVQNEGAVYEGEWKDGTYHGQGKFTYANGECV